VAAGMSTTGTDGCSKIANKTFHNPLFAARVLPSQRNTAVATSSGTGVNVVAPDMSDVFRARSARSEVPPIGLQASQVPPQVPCQIREIHLLGGACLTKCPMPLVPVV